MEIECKGPIDLKTIESKYRLLFECAQDMVFIVDITGKILDANYAAIKEYGYTLDELLAMNVKDIRVPSERDTIEKQFKEAFENGAVYETVHIRKNGSTFPVEISSRGIILNNKSLLLAIVRDITKRKKAEEKIAYVTTFPEWNPNPILEIDENETVTSSNPAARRLFPDLPSKGADHPMIKGLGLIKSRSLKEGKNQFARDVQINGVFYHQTIMYMPEKKKIRIYAVDITELKHAEQALEDIKERLLLAQRVAHIGTFEWNIQTGVNKWTPELEVMYGLPPGGFPGTREAWEKLLFPDDRPHVLKKVHEATDSGSFEDEWRVVWPDGTIHWIYGRASVLKDEFGKPLKMIGVNIDITHRKKVDEALRESEKRFRSIFEQAPLAIALIDSITGRFLKINPRYVEIIGRSEAEMQKTTFMAISHPDDLQKDLDNMARLFSGDIESYKMEKRLFRGDGSIIWVILTVVPLWEGKEQSYPKMHIAIVEDVTERRRIEGELQRRAALIDLSPDGIFVRTLDGTITFWSRGAEYVYGWTREEAMGKKSSELLKKQFPQPMEEINQQLRKTGFWSGDVIESTKDNRQIVVQSRWRAQYDSQGNVSEIMESNVDITQRKHAEDELSNQKQRAELYLDLMSHDINNMLQIGIGFLELYRDTEKKGLEETEFIEKALGSLHNSTKLIENVRKLQKVEAHELHHYPIDVCKLLSDVRTDFQKIPDRDVTINLAHYCECLVNANALLKDVFTNLVGNAIKHSTGPIIININIKDVYEGGQMNCYISIEDNGPGIPPELKSRLFTRFQQGAIKARGRGLGLYLVKTLVEDFHGKIWVEDRIPGDYTKGSRFVVMFPAAQANNFC